MKEEEEDLSEERGISVFLLRLRLHFSPLAYSQPAAAVSPPEGGDTTDSFSCILFGGKTQQQQQCHPIPGANLEFFGAVISVVAAWPLRAYSLVVGGTDVHLLDLFSGSREKQGSALCSLPAFSAAFRFGLEGHIMLMMT